MKILAADTALGALSVALVEDGDVLAEEWRAMERGHAEALAPMADTLMRRAGVSFAALERLAVTTGPGTFAGQRVGLAFMRALALALKKPLQWLRHRLSHNTTYRSITRLKLPLLWLHQSLSWFHCLPVSKLEGALNFVRASWRNQASLNSSKACEM